MTKFKAGDTVKAIETWADYITKDTRYMVLATVEGSLGQILTVMGDAGRKCRGYAHRFELVPADDELPPAPESVMYFNSVREPSNTQNLYVRKHFNLPDRISIGVAKSGYHGNTGGVGYPNVLSINLDPDSALQLASDIRRIAMSIKRNQKQESQLC